SSRDTQDAERRLIELSDLLEISQTLNQSLQLETILNHFLLASMGRFAIGRGMFLLAQSDGRFRVAVAKGLPNVAPGLEVEVACPPQAHALVAEAGPGFEFFAERKLAVLIPLVRAGTCVGLLALGAKLTRKEFEAEELEFLGSLASVATPAVENSRVYGELQDVNARLDRKVHELNTLFEIGRRFVGTLEPDE